MAICQVRILSPCAAISSFQMRIFHYLLRVNPREPVSVPPAQKWPARVFPALFGGFLGLSLLKFGNPPIMEKWVDAPGNIYEFLVGFPWPMVWAYRLLVLVGIAGLLIARPKPRAKWWLAALPIAWFVWQIIA